jgi:CBS domain-containing protein
MYGRLADLMAEKGRQIYTTKEGASVYDAVYEMNHHRVGAVLVMDGERPVGIFTERDVLRRVVSTNLNPELTRVVDVMTGDPVIADLGMLVGDAMTMMTERRFRHLPVREDGRVIGMVSIGDLIRWVLPGPGQHGPDQSDLP